MLALAAWRDTRCTQCGGNLEETTSPDNDGSPGHGAYLANDPLRCHRCAALSRSEKAYTKDEHPHSLIHQVTHRPPRL
jgi:uncharacterized protein with PIN domain